MGRFHRHDDGSVHEHHHDASALENADHDHIGDHSGYVTGRERIDVLEHIFSENDAAAAGNRAQFDAAGVLAINLMSSPGAGKTTVLAQTLSALPDFRCGVIEGDIETPIDADRLRPLAAQVSLLNTAAGFGGECHLDAPMVAHALKNLDLAELDLLFIENVGNLVCPAEFDVGAHRTAMVTSVTEGEDKPLKYPVMFRNVDAIIINKIDLLPHLNFDLGLFLANIRAVNPHAALFETSATRGTGLASWIDWVTHGVRPWGG